MSLKDTIENHPIKVIGGFVVAAGLIVASFMGWRHTVLIDTINAAHKGMYSSQVTAHNIKMGALSRKIGGLNGKITDLQKRLGSIERGFGDKHTLDISKFYLDKQRLAELSEQAQYHSDFNFYARHDDEKWTYDKGTQIDIAKHTLGEDHPFLQGGVEYIDGGKNIVHIWRGKKPWIILDDPSPIKRIFPYISLTRVDRKNLNIQGHEWFEKLGTDHISFFLTQQVMEAALFSLNMDKITHVIKDIGQKDRKVAYIQVIFLVNDVMSKGQYIDKIFLTQEVYGIIAGDFLYILNIGIPSQEPGRRGDYFGWVNEWLSDFGIVVSPY